MPSNFEFLRVYQPFIAEYAMDAERVVYSDPRGSLSHLRNFAESLAQVLHEELVGGEPPGTFFDVLEQLKRGRRRIPNHILDTFHFIRREANSRVHPQGALARTSPADSLPLLRKAWLLAKWYHEEVLNNTANVPSEYRPPESPFLTPLDFEIEKRKYREYFTGREWILGSGGVINRWLKDMPESRVFWLVGGPGFGKSAIATQIALREDVVAIHYCVYSSEDTRDPTRTIRSIAGQLRLRLPEYGAVLDELPLSEEIGKTPSTLFRNLLSNPLSRAYPGPRKTQLIVIDGLDEATQNNRDNQLTRLIAQQWQDLPQWLRLVITSRRDSTVSQLLSGLDPFEFNAESAENIEDIKSYLEEMITRLEGTSPSEATLRTVLKKSEGLFLYVNYFIQALNAGTLSLDNPEKFPQGLRGVYHQFFEREYPDLTHYEKEIAPLLSVICAARDPLPLSLLSDAINHDRFRVLKRLRNLGTLFSVNDDLIVPFHKSLVDWLTDESSVVGDYTLNLKGGHELIADGCLRDWRCQDSKPSQYTVSHLSAHLAAIGDFKSWLELLTDPRWLRIHISASRIGTLIEDYNVYLAKSETWESAIGSIANALRLSAPTLNHDPEELPAQLWARLFHEPFADTADSKLLMQLPSVAQRPWLRAVGRGALEEPGGFLSMVLRGHAATINTLAFSPSVGLVATGSGDHSICLWDWSNGRCLRRFAHEDGGVICISWSRDSSMLASTSDSGSVQIWDVRTGAVLPFFGAAIGEIECIHWSPKRDLLAIGARNGCVQIIDVESSKVEATLSGHGSKVCRIAWSPDGELLLSGSEDGLIIVWNTINGICSRTFRGHELDICGLAWWQGNQFFASASIDGKMRVWDAITGECVGQLELDSRFTGAIAWSSRETRFAYGCSDQIRIIQYFETCDAGNDPSTISLSSIIANPLNLDEVTNWDEGAANVEIHRGHSDIVTCIAIDRGRLASGGEDSALIIWGVRSAGVYFDDEESSRPHSSAVWSVSWSPDGRYLASGASDGCIYLWNTATGENAFTTVGFAPVCWSPDGARLAFGCRFSDSESSIGIWCRDTDKVQRHFFKNQEAVISLDWSPDGTFLASGSSDNKVRIWNVGTGECLAVLEGHTNLPFGLKWSNDGFCLASGSFDQTVRVWRVDSGECIAVLEGHAGGVERVAWSPDDSQIVTYFPQVVCIWDVSTWECIETIHLNEIENVLVRAPWLKSFFVQCGLFTYGFVPDAQAVWAYHPGPPELVGMGDAAGRVGIFRVEMPGDTLPP